jgi:HSP20 family protein
MTGMGRIDTMLPLDDVGDLADQIQRLFADLDRARPLDQRLLPGVFSPTLDALETADAIEIVVDLPGVAVDDVRVLLKDDIVLIAGGKMPPDPGERTDASFHLVERDFGRFARAVRVGPALDASQASATLGNGELRVRIPKINDRRGREILVPVTRASGG